MEPFAVEHQGWTVRFSHHPLEALADGELNVHGHIHQNPAPSPKHFNASVEQIDYGPVSLSRVLDDLVAVNGGARAWGVQRAAPGSRRARTR